MPETQVDMVGPKELLPAAAMASPPPPDATVVEAARVLGGRPKHKFGGRRRIKRKWSGFIEKERCWQGRQVILPDGRSATLLRAYRGTAIVCVGQNNVGVQTQRLSVPAGALRLSKLPAAVLLGRRKLGVEERKSAVKAESSRQNGKQPVRIGSRKRGRPRRDTPLWTRFKINWVQGLRPGMTTAALLKVVIRQDGEIKAAVAAAKAKDLEKARRSARLAGIQLVQ
jgi:hypothetical protein